MNVPLDQTSKNHSIAQSDGSAYSSSSSASQFDQSSHSKLRYFPDTRPWYLAELRELYQFRELLWMFFQRDIKIRYRQVVIGLLWVLLQPTLGMAIFLAIFWLVDAKPTADQSSYASTATIVYLGMLVWQFVASSLRDATGSLVNYRHVITKIAFPRLLLPLSNVLCAGFDLMVASLLLPLVIYLGNDHIVWTTSWICILPLAGLAIFVVGCAAWTSSLNAFYRDVGYALPFALQLGMFISPVIYDLSRVQQSNSIPGWLKILYEANPVGNAIGWIRHLLLGGIAPMTTSTLLACCIAIIVFFTGLAWFRAQNAKLADRI